MRLDPLNYPHVPPAVVMRARVHVVGVSHLFGSARGFTFGRHIWITRPALPAYRLIAHELVHVQQFDIPFGVIRLPVRYIAEYVRNRFQGDDHRNAYLRVSYELDARDRVRTWDWMQQPEIP